MRNMLKTVRTTISAMLKITLVLLVILVLTPIGYFTWRAGQPMDMLQYSRRTYYELLAERKAAYAVLAEKYQASHPNIDVNNGMCFTNEVMISVAYTLPWAGFCSLAEVIPPLQSLIGPSAKKAGCLLDQNGSITNFFQDWWATFEKMLFSSLEYRPHGPVAYCRISAP
jgi:hypothetical protein